MKQVFTLLLIAASFAATAQTAPAPTAPVLVGKKDTVTVPVVLFEKTDTVQAQFLYITKANMVKYAKGQLIVKGYKVQEKGKLLWAKDPLILTALDEFKHPVKLLQVLQNY